MSRLASASRGSPNLRRVTEEEEGEWSEVVARFDSADNDPIKELSMGQGDHCDCPLDSDPTGGQEDAPIRRLCGNLRVALEAELLEPRLLEHCLCLHGIIPLLFMLAVGVTGRPEAPPPPPALPPPFIAPAFISAAVEVPVARYCSVPWTKSFSSNNKSPVSGP